MRARRFLLLAVGTFAMLAFTSVSLWAQFSSGIEGTVTDPSGAVIANATVTIKNVGTTKTQTVTTSAAGNYRFDALPSSVFEITATAPGFKTSLQQGVSLEVLQTRQVNFKLELGATSTEVTVTAAPPPVEMNEARVSELIGERRMENLPLVGRNFTTLVVLTPGVTGIPSGGGQTYAMASNDVFNNELGVQLNANGLRQEANSFLVDNGSVDAGPRGGVTNMTPNPDSIQEVRVSVNNFSAEYGRNASAAVNISTRSGANAFHGNVSYLHTNNHLTAGNIFQNGCITRHDGSCDRLPVFQRNEVGYGVGGPIVKDRTFFWTSLDYLDSTIGSSARTSVVSPEFANYMKTAYPNNISTFVMNTFPAAVIRQEVQKTALSEVGGACPAGGNVTTPVGTLPCDFPLTNGALLVQPIGRNGLQWQFRIDQQFTNDRFYVSYYHTKKDTLFSQSTYPDFSVASPQFNQFANVHYSHIFSPTVLFETNVSMIEPSGSVSSPHDEIPRMNVPGIAAYGFDFADAGFINTNAEWKAMMSWNKGSHSFKFGGNIGRDMGWGSGANFGMGGLRPQYSFNNLYDYALDDPFSESNYGFDPQTGERAGPMFAPVSRRYGLFAEDTWKVKPNLTVTMGLRFEDFPPAIAKNASRKTNPPPALSAILIPGDGATFGERIANGVNTPGPYFFRDLKGLAPRLSLAWDPTKQGKMSVRFGIGRFFDRPSSQGLYHDGGAELPFYSTASFAKNTPPAVPIYGLCASGDPPYNCPVNPNITTGLDSKGGLIGGKGGLNTWDPYPEMPYTFNWFSGVQYAFTSNWVVEANYVGSQGHRLLQSYDVNRFTGDLIQNDGVLTRLNTSFGGLYYIQTNGWSAYHGANVSARKRFSQGLDFQVAYTVGKAMDTASTYGTGLSIVDALNINNERGLSVYDVRQKLAASFVYQIPGPKQGIASKLLGGWQAGGIIIFQSGTPFGVFCGRPFIPVRDVNGVIVGNDGCDYNADGFTYDRPNAPSFGNFKSGTKQDFLTGLFPASEFSAPGLGELGSLGRNTFIGPGYANADLNFGKNTKIPWFLGNEGATLQFRAELYNAFNRVNINNPANNLTDGSFGRSNSAYPARNIQLVLRLSF